MEDKFEKTIEQIRIMFEKGKERIDDDIILSLKNRLPEAEKKTMLEEATGVSEWIYAVIRKVSA